MDKGEELIKETLLKDGEMQRDIELREEVAPDNYQEITGSDGTREGASPDSDQEEVLVLKKELDLAREEVSKNYEQYLRALAEVDNIKKRAMRERDEYAKFSTLPLLKKLLTVLDDLERAITMSDNNQDYEVLVKGIEMITKKLQDILQAEGIKGIEAQGKNFDPQLHEPLLIEKSDIYPDNTVIEELQKGYILHGRVIRPSLVKVSN